MSLNGIMQEHGICALEKQIKKRAILDVFGEWIAHDSFSDYVANEHLDWTASVGTIHTDNYIENPFGASIGSGDIGR